ncbi:MAG: 50S ribosomal protein L29 [Spirochaetia bacterium]|nr:50S ribosomal protein L29 [Spirochaetia bacterium]MCF7953235.1 50S ribosomal protein L29 [Spirochaetales bacterium]
MKNSFNDLTFTEIVNKRNELRKEYMDLRINKVMGHLENPVAIRNVRKQLARLNTIVHEYALGIRENN